MSLDLSRCRLPPYAHQRDGIEALVVHPYFALFDEMGVGKSKQCIDGAQVMFTMDMIDRVLIIAPASVRAVWYDPELGEFAKHLWEDLPATITEYHAKTRKWLAGPVKSARRLEVVVTNYDFIRSVARLEQLLSFCGQRTLLICDEANAVKSHRAQQTRAVLRLRRASARVVLLTGTPIANSPLDMFSLGQIMNPKILDCRTYFHFRARYAVLGGWQQKQVIAWQNIEDLQKRFAPYVLRRLKEDCLDLPKKLPTVMLTATLTPETWNVYREMRDEMVSWLSSNTVAVAAQAGVKAMRLAQITSGFLGGVQVGVRTEESTTTPDGPSPLWGHENEDLDTFESPPIDILTGNLGPSNPEDTMPAIVTETQEIGREKLEVFFEWLTSRLIENPTLKILVWCRFRAELARVARELVERFPQVAVGEIHGGQKRDERDKALRLLDPRTMPAGPVVVVGTPASGSMGLNLTGASVCVWLSSDFSLKTRLQADDRIHRPGQVNVVSYFDVVAVGPKGQKTVDHVIMKALRDKQDVATWTCAAWIQALRDE